MEIQYSNYVISQLGGEWTERIPPPYAVVINSWISLTFGISRLLCSKRLTQKRNLFSFSMVIAMTRRFLVKKIVCVNKDQINYKSLTWLQHKIPYNSFYHLRIFHPFIIGPILDVKKGHQESAQFEHTNHILELDIFG